MFATVKVVCVFRTFSVFQKEVASSCHFMLYVHLHIYRRVGGFRAGNRKRS